ncbi:MAG: DNA gyrase C-terminal beta-propeller domain-containing protein [Candidatus Sungiibacteriota bacterium]
MIEIKDKYADERHTLVVKSSPRALSDEDLIADEEVVVVLTRGGYIKRLKPESWRMQKRGGKGLIGMETKEEDMVEQLLACRTHAALLFFTDTGKVYRVAAHEVPEGSRTAKGKAIFNLLSIGAQERVTSILAIPKGLKPKGGEMFVVMATKDGIMKKVDAISFETVRASGLIALTIKSGDMLRWARITGGKDEIMLITKQGQAIRFYETDIRPMGRQAAGVHAMRMKKDDEVVGMDIITSAESKKIKDKNTAAVNGKLLAVMENGFGKTTPLTQYKRQHRGGSGIKTAKITPKTGALVSARIIAGEEEEIIAISRKGVVIRTTLATIPSLSRSTQGVRIMKMEEGDAVASIITL